MARFSAPPPKAPIAEKNKNTYGTCDAIALTLRKKLRYTENAH